MGANKMTELEKYVRCRLGQDFDKQVFGHYNGYAKPIHKRFDFGAQHNCHKEACKCNDNKYINNRKICKIFECDVYPYRMVVYVWKGSSTGYLISRDGCYDDYWDKENWIDGVNGDLDMSYVYKKEYSGMGTVDILIDLKLQARILRSDDTYFHSFNNVTQR